MSAARGNRTHHAGHGLDDEEDKPLRALLPGIAAGSFGERQAIGQQSDTTNPGIGGTRNEMIMPNQRAGVDAGWPALFAFERTWPGTTHHERSA